MLPSERIWQEQTLRAGVLVGDQAAWRLLYDSACQQLWDYVVWRCAGLRDLAEDITQDTWLVAVRRLSDFDPQQGSFLSWLRGIAAKTMHNHLRARRRKERSLDGQDVAGPMPDLDQAELIACALADLPERYEAVLRAKYADLLTVQEIAAENDETPKAIESLLSRARAAFRTAYEKLAGSNEPARANQP